MGPHPTTCHHRHSNMAVAPSSHSSVGVSLSGGPPPFVPGPSRQNLKRKQLRKHHAARHGTQNPTPTVTRREVPQEDPPARQTANHASPRKCMLDVESRGHHTAPLPSRYTDHYEAKISSCKIKYEADEDFEDTWGTAEDLLGCRNLEVEAEEEEYLVEKEEFGYGSEAFDEDAGPKAGLEKKDTSIQSFVGSFRNSLRFTL